MGKKIRVGGDIILSNDEFDPVLFLFQIRDKNKYPSDFINSLYTVPPNILYEILKYSNRENWFASTIYGEMVKRYEIIYDISKANNNKELLGELIRICLALWMELKPVNKETIDITTGIFKRKLIKGGPLKLVSLTCPAYTVGREQIADSIIKNRVNFFVNLTSNTLRNISNLVSEWHIYVWEPSALEDPILRETVHPNLLKNYNIEAQLERNWGIFSEVIDSMSKEINIKIVHKTYKELIENIYAAKDILDRMEIDSRFHSKSIARILRHGRGEYEKMGENIDEHRERFWSDSYIYTASVLKYGFTNGTKKNPLSVMISIESRIHHITGLRLYHFESGDNKFLLPVWNYPSWIRSFYWVNEGDETINDKIISAQDRWDRFENWNKKI
jgi:hypothetical protein